MESKRCFLIQPFDKGQFDKRCKDIFEPAIKKAGLEPYRVDQDISATVLIETIEREIKSATVCLADISTDNPNVWYELGFALALEKPVVIVCEKQREKFPFDIQHRSIIQYATESSSDFEELKQKITDKILAFLNSNPKTNSNQNIEEKVNSFDVNWYDIETKQIIGKELSINHTFGIFPKHIPDYTEPESRSHSAYSIVTPIFDKINKNYYRELVDFLFKQCCLFSVALSIKNIGNSIAKDVRIEIRVKKEYIYSVYEHTNIPDKEDIPQKRKSIVEIDESTFRNLKRECDLTVTEEFNIFKIETEYNQIQMGRSINCEPC
jgi:nucleoside 2-deoxyribosyltransferase